MCACVCLTEVLIPRQVLALENEAQGGGGGQICGVAAGLHYTAAWSADEMLMWGQNTYGKWGRGAMRVAALGVGQDERQWTKCDTK